MRERNSHIPYPELRAPTSTLERLAVDAAHGKLLPYAQIPDVIAAGNIETYANWMFELSINDPLQRERGAVIHVRKADNHIIFPSNPHVGTEGSCTPVVSKRRDTFYPSVDVHSHAADIGPSPSYGDVGAILEGSGDISDHIVAPYMVVATTRHNFLVIKTEDTPFVDRDTAGKKETEMFDHEKKRKFLKERIDQSSANSLDLYWDFLQGKEPRLPSDLAFIDFYDATMDVFNLSKAYNLGFYTSDKDGNYVRVTEDRLTEYLTEMLDERLMITKLYIA